ncbi:tyrosine-type recombinase/integrase [Alkanindiges illinoisensis]|uniref:tyrosine-type recombinase/integrase n=1 Tax=Alkanindiges illinoisensis TaxID=197183 RepID=UPI0006850623|nr:site-specific integrase [Alkanindiges illinoisensis]
MITLNNVTAYYLHYSEHTSKDRDKYAYARFELFYGDIEITAITRQSLRDYIHFRRAAGVTDATINREFRSLRAAINYYFTDHELSHRNPLANFSLSESEPRIRFLSNAEAARLIYASKDNYFLNCFIKLALNTGCRSGELLRLSWDRVDFNNRYLILNRENTKSKRRRFIALNETAMQVLHEMKLARANNTWVFYNEQTGTHILSLKKGFRLACKMAKIDNLRIHDLRHTFASWLVQSGIPLYTVRDLLGHTCITTTERYAHLQIDNLRDALKSLPTF